MYICIIKYVKIKTGANITLYTVMSEIMRLHYRYTWPVSTGNKRIKSILLLEYFIWLQKSVEQM